MILEKERKEVIKYGKKMIELGITVGTFGNISVYNPEEKLMAITPSGMDYFELKPEDIVVMDTDGNVVDGNRKPSSEVDMHRIFYQNRPGINAVVHTHSTYATILACLRWPIEPIHYIVAYAGKDVPCIPYVQFGTYELAKAAYEGMEDRNAVLLGNHGLLAVGPNLSYALDVAQQIEFLSEIYYKCRVAGGGVNLTEKELEEVIGKFSSYRQA